MDGNVWRQIRQTGTHAESRNRTGIPYPEFFRRQGIECLLDLRVDRNVARTIGYRRAHKRKNQQPGDVDFPASLTQWSPEQVWARYEDALLQHRHPILNVGRVGDSVTFLPRFAWTARAPQRIRPDTLIGQVAGLLRRKGKADRGLRGYLGSHYRISYPRCPSYPDDVPLVIDTAFAGNGSRLIFTAPKREYANVARLYASSLGNDILIDVAIKEINAGEPLFLLPQRRREPPWINVCFSNPSVTR